MKPHELQAASARLVCVCARPFVVRSDPLLLGRADVRLAGGSACAAEVAAANPSAPASAPSARRTLGLMIAPARKEKGRPETRPPREALTQAAAICTSNNRSPDRSRNRKHALIARCIRDRRRSSCSSERSPRARSLRSAWPCLWRAPNRAGPRAAAP